MLRTRTPEDIAADVVKAFSGDEYWIDVDMAIIAIAAALRDYGDERAKAERERAIQVAEGRALLWEQHGGVSIASPYSHLTIQGEARVIAAGIAALD